MQHTIVIDDPRGVYGEGGVNTALHLLGDIQDANGSDCGVSVTLKAPAGPLGMDPTEFGVVIQAVAQIIVDREEHTTQEVADALRAWDGEGLWWEGTGGPLVDELTRLLFPEED